MEFRAHGANPEKLYAAAGLPTPAKIYDFSTNTNAVPQRGGFVPDLRAALEDYPDGDCLALREALAREFGAPAKNILVSSGSNEAIYIIASYAAARENLILQPVYGEYKKALDGYGARTRNIFSLAEAEGARGAAVWLCNPCNPTGALISGAELDAAAERNPETLFIIDEAYRDFVWTEQLPRAPKILPNVVRLRSLTKIYDLCGARVGALVSHEAAVEKIKARQPEWSVSGLAQQAALWRAGDETLKARTREYYAREIPRLTAALREAGYAVRPTCANFFLVEAPDDEDFIRFMLERGIVVRHTRNFAGLDGKFVRIAARTKDEDDLLIAAAREYAAARNIK
ncbi:aminotransferase class I/II-fold pyridoxal phosphate-dependent enzyme [uncultured Cloacibacillus sp.]|uniref:aminotransferase class I/II-fold pyridoxal phosphate-dependent enzyme n=1 Tax=uncultured Cloacibacillus sp. TaxID=889794 RepID=UPI0026DBDD35|nr:aminotransferase class I/II-fold pyridoxal phosphate-dependent enzyme [uncultured Cloacibacillus sp.]